jgi:hypothetical protein
MAFLVGAVISGVICVAIANAKGRNPVIWGVLGFLFGLFAIVACACLPRPRHA